MYQLEMLMFFRFETLENIKALMRNSFEIYGDLFPLKLFLFRVFKRVLVGQVEFNINLKCQNN